MLKPGIKGHQEVVVTKELTAAQMGSGVLEIFDDTNNHVDDTALFPCQIRQILYTRSFT